MDHTRGLVSDDSRTTRLQDKAELQNLNARLSEYVASVRQLSELGGQGDLSAFHQSAKILETEVFQLKNLYENELDQYRKQLEFDNFERSSLNQKSKKQQKYIGELQNRLTVEEDKNHRLLDELSFLQRRTTNLQAAVHDAEIESEQPQAAVVELQKVVNSLTQEVNLWKEKFQMELVANENAEERLQQLIKQASFSDHANHQQITDYQTQLESVTTSILTLKSHMGDLGMEDLSLREMLKQIEESTDAELKRYQAEYEEQFSKNLSSLQSQIDADMGRIASLSLEKKNLATTLGELQRNMLGLEGQVLYIQQQKKSLEQSMMEQRGQRAKTIQEMEQRLRNLLDEPALVSAGSRTSLDADIPITAEILAFKSLLDEEHRLLGRYQASRNQAEVTSAPGYLTHLDLPTSKPDHTPVIIDGLFHTGNNSASPPGWFSPQQNGSHHSHFDPTKSHSAGAIRATSEPNLAHESIPDLKPIPTSASSGFSQQINPSNQSESLFQNKKTTSQLAPRFHYQSTPSLSQVQVDFTPFNNSAYIPASLNRVESAPVKSNNSKTKSGKREKSKKDEKKKWNYIQANIGCGRDYFEKMFCDVKNSKSLISDRPHSSHVEQQLLSSFNDYTVSTSSALDDITIAEVDQDGKFVRLVNEGLKELELGGYIIRQNVEGHPVAVFQFPPDVKFPAGSEITIWSAEHGSEVHQSPSSFLWQDGERWGTGPEYSTILCRPNGQAVAWITAAHRPTGQARQGTGSTARNRGVNSHVEDGVSCDDSDATSFSSQAIDIPDSKPGTVSLGREKLEPVVLSRPRGNILSQSGDKENLTANISRESKQQKSSQEANFQLSKGSVQLAQANFNLSRTHQGLQLPPPCIRGDGTLLRKQNGLIHLAPSSPYSSSLQEQSASIEPTRSQQVTLSAA